MSNNLAQISIENQLDEINSIILLLNLNDPVILLDYPSFEIEKTISNHPNSNQELTASSTIKSQFSQPGSFNTEENTNVSQNLGQSMFNLNLYLGIMNAIPLKGKASIVKKLIIFWVKNFGYCYAINFVKLIRIIKKENLKIKFFDNLDKFESLFSLMKFITSPILSIYDCDVKLHSFIILLFSPNNILKNLISYNNNKYELTYIHEQTTQIIRLTNDCQEIRISPNGDIKTIESDTVINELEIHHRLSIMLKKGMICINEYDSINSFRINLNQYSKYVLHTNFILTFVNSVFLIEKIQYPHPILNHEIDFYKETLINEINPIPLLMITPLKNTHLSSMIYKPSEKNLTIYIERIGKDMISFSERTPEEKNVIATISYNHKKGWIFSQTDDPSKDNETYVYLSPFRLNGEFIPYNIQLDVPLITINLGFGIIKIIKL